MLIAAVTLLVEVLVEVVVDEVVMVGGDVIGPGLGIVPSI